MKRNLLTAIAAALMISAGSSWANASAQISFGPVGASQIGEGYSVDFGLEGFEYFDLAPLQSQTFTWDWSVSVKDDGLAATRDWYYLPGEYYVYSGPNATGRELAAVSVDIITAQPGSPNDPYVTFQYGGRCPGVISALVPGSFTDSGTCSLTVTNIDSLSRDSGVFNIVVGAFVDSAAPVPEPSGLALMAIGAAVLALRRNLVRAGRRCPSGQLSS